MRSSETAVCLKRCYQIRNKMIAMNQPFFFKSVHVDMDVLFTVSSGSSTFIAKCDEKKNEI